MKKGAIRPFFCGSRLKIRKPRGDKYARFRNANLYATSLVIQFITGLDVVSAIVIVSVIALTYTMMGGITAVIWIDVIHCWWAALIIFVALVLPNRWCSKRICFDGRQPSD